MEKDKKRLVNFAREIRAQVRTTFPISHLHASGKKTDACCFPR
jgi:hypothetical protein